MLRYRKVENERKKWSCVWNESNFIKFMEEEKNGIKELKREEKVKFLRRKRLKK